MKWGSHSSAFPLGELLPAGFSVGMQYAFLNKEGDLFYLLLLCNYAFFFFFDMAGPQPGKTRGYACPVVSPLTLPSPPCSTSMILLVPCAMQPALQVSSSQQGNASAADCLEFELPAVEACSNCPRMLTAKIWTQERRYESTI